MSNDFTEVNVSEKKKHVKTIRNIFNSCRNCGFKNVTGVKCENCNFPNQTDNNQLSTINKIKEL